MLLVCVCDCVFRRNILIHLQSFSHGTGVCNCVFRRNILIHLQSFSHATGVCVWLCIQEEYPHSPAVTQPCYRCVCNCVFRRNILIHLQSFSHGTGVCVTVYSGGISSFTCSHSAMLLVCVWLCIQEEYPHSPAVIQPCYWCVWLCIQEEYPHSPPIWFSESDDAVLSAVLEKLTDCSPQNNNVRRANVWWLNWWLVDVMQPSVIMYCSLSVCQSVCVFEMVNGDVIHSMLLCPRRLFLSHNDQVTVIGKAHIQNDLQLEKLQSVLSATALLVYCLGAFVTV